MVVVSKMAQKIQGVDGLILMCCNFISISNRYIVVGDVLSLRMVFLLKFYAIVRVYYARARVGSAAQFAP